MLTTRAVPPKPPPPEVSISPLLAQHLPVFRRLTTLLLPIRYPESFFKQTITLANIASVSRVALWGNEQKVIGAIRCVLELVPAEPHTDKKQGWEALMARTEADDHRKGSHRIYLATLFTLAPYRSLGIATALLNEILDTAKRVSVAAEYSPVSYIYAHVWEANDEALAWYTKNQFLEWGFVENYYPRLTPSGAKVLRRFV